jgi:hypothetical protein
MQHMKNSRTFVMALVVSSTLASGAYAAEKSAGSQNFRFALPDDYAVVQHQVNPALQGGSVIFAPAAEASSKERILRLQTYPSEYYPESLQALGTSKPREFLNTVIETQLQSKCTSSTVDSGKIREQNGETRINWWTSCELANQPGQFEFERGRMFLSATGAYFISHINESANKNHQFARNEIKWFDKYLYNSGFCISGNDCGEEGALIPQLFTEK